MWKKWSSFWKRAFWWRDFITVMFSLFWVSCFPKRDFHWWSYLTWNTETCVTSFAVKRGSVARKWTQTHQICMFFALHQINRFVFVDGFHNMTSCTAHNLRSSRKWCCLRLHKLTVSVFFLVLYSLVLS